MTNSDVSCYITLVRQYKTCLSVVTMSLVFSSLSMNCCQCCKVITIQLIELIEFNVMCSYFVQCMKYFVIIN